MLRSIFIALGLLAAQSTLAWEVDIYSDSTCNDGTASDFEYYILTGTGQSSCYILSQYPPPDMNCSYYDQGGNGGPYSCYGGFTTSGGIKVSSGNCYFYAHGSCSGDGFGSSAPGCGAQAIQSFSCGD